MGISGGLASVPIADRRICPKLHTLKVPGSPCELHGTPFVNRM